MAGEHAVIQFQTRVIPVTLARPANTTPYTAGDVISDTANGHYEFVDALTHPRFSGSISNAMIIGSGNNSGGLADLELWLFGRDVADRADNLAVAFTDAEMLTLIGVIEFPVANWRVGLPTADTGNTVNEVRGIGMALQTGYSSIYGQLVVRNAYTPLSAEEFTAILAITRD